MEIITHKITYLTWHGRKIFLPPQLRNDSLGIGPLARRNQMGKPHSIYLADDEAAWVENHPEHESKSGAVRAAIREQMETDAETSTPEP